MKFPKQDLKDIVFESDGDTVIRNEITHHGRWSVTHSVIFKHDGKFYRTSYSKGATESQDERPYEYDGAEIECPEVEEYQKLVTDYRDVKPVKKDTK